MDTGSFNSSDGDINAVIDESHNVAVVKNGSKFLCMRNTCMCMTHMYVLCKSYFLFVYLQYFYCNLL